MTTTTTTTATLTLTRDDLQTAICEMARGYNRLVEQRAAHPMYSEVWQQCSVQLEKNLRLRRALVAVLEGTD